MSRELVREFRTAAWGGPQAVEEFVRRCASLPTESGQAMLAVLIDRRAVSEARLHQLRIAVFDQVIELDGDRELFTPMLRSLRQADPATRERFIQWLPKVNNVGAHRELVQLFRHADPEIRRAAQQVTVAVGGKTAFGMLGQLVSMTDFPGRLEAIEAMTSMAGYHSVPALRAALAPATQDEKLRILEFLGSPDFVKKNRDVALEALSDLLQDPDERVMRDAVMAFGRVADEERFLEFIEPLLGRGTLAFIVHAISAMATYRSQRIIGVLREQLLLGPKTVRVAVLESLERIATEDALPVIAEALNHRQIAVRLRAAEALKALSDRGQLDVARTVAWLLRSADVQVRRVAADVARSVRDPEGTLWPQLLRFLRDEDWWVRERITDALVEMAGSSLTRHVVGYLSDANDVVRRYGVEMLMRIADPASLGALVRAAQSDDDWWVRERAIEAIGVLHDQRAVPYIVDLMNRDAELRMVALETLRKLGDRSAATHVARLLTEPDVPLLLSALQCLQTFGDASLGSSVVPLAEHEDHRVRLTARELLSRWKLDEQLGEWDDATNKRMTALDRLLYAMARANGDDLLLAPDRKPYVKRMGETLPLARKIFTEDQLKALLWPNLKQVQRDALDAGQDVDFSYEVRSEGLRFRVNVFRAHTGLSAVFRIIKNVIPALEELGLPSVIHRFGDLANGLVLIGGPTGSGKSTTLAALIDYINRTYRKHIITLEDPIEVVHKPKKSLVNQREIGTHTNTFHSALRSTLREDPDVILVGEMRDLETIKFAISAAETGHLVFGTVHTASADTTVDRLINAFPHGQQPQVRSILASSLRAVCCQYLAPRKDGSGRLPVVEIMLNNDAVANLIRKGKTYQIPNLIAVSRETGMRSMDNELTRLLKEGVIGSDIAYMRAMNKKEMEAVIEDLEGSGSQRIVGQLSGDHPTTSR